jgi:hypothetical protein
LIDDVVDKRERSLPKLLLIIAAERNDIERRRLELISWMTSCNWSCGRVKITEIG